MPNATTMPIKFKFFRIKPSYTDQPREDIVNHDHPYSSGGLQQPYCDCPINGWNYKYNDDHHTTI